jgi:small conductance mechanosensitive channel
MVVVDEQRVLEAIFLVVLPAVVGTLASKWVGDAAKRRGSSPGTVRGLRVAITIVWIAIVAYGISLALGPVSILSTLTVSAIAGIAVTLALQTTLQNLVAGFILLRNNFLRPGDQISISGIKGRVANIGLVDTVIKLEDGTLVFLSNSTLMSGPLVNYTASQRLSGEY